MNRVVKESPLSHHHLQWVGHLADYQPLLPDSNSMREFWSSLPVKWHHQISGLYLKHNWLKVFMSQLDLNITIFFLFPKHLLIMQKRCCKAVLGWNQLCYGRFAQAWCTLQEDHLHNYKTQNATMKSEQWLVA